MTMNRRPASRKPTTLQLGTISKGTLRPEDLIPAYLDALDSIRLTKAERQEVNAVRFDHNRGDYFGSDDGSDNVDTLTTMENHAPEYSYFGTLEGDGACFGVWANIEDLEENTITRDRYLDPHDPRAHGASVIKVNAGDEFPSAIGVGRNGVNHIMSVTDHGNVTLYRRAGNRWIEVWSVV